MCINSELDARACAGAGVNTLGSTNEDTTSDDYGKFQYDNRTQRLLRGPHDPRTPSLIALGKKADGSADANTNGSLTFNNPLDGTSYDIEKTAPVFCPESKRRGLLFKSTEHRVLS